MANWAPVIGETVGWTKPSFGRVESGTVTIVRETKTRWVDSNGGLWRKDNLNQYPRSGDYDADRTLCPTTDSKFKMAQWKFQLGSKMHAVRRATDQLSIGSADETAKRLALVAFALKEAMAVAEAGPA